MISFRRKLTGLLEVIIGLGLIVGFFPASTLLNVNPSPFFLLVIYGAWVAGPVIGLFSGLLSSVLYLAMLTTTTAFPFNALWTFIIADPSHYLTPMFLLVAGYVFGELRTTLERRMQRLRDQASLMQQEASEARSRLQQAETALFELQGRVLGQTATMTRLYQIAQSLNVLSVEKILTELLGVLEDLLQVEQASIYRVEESNRFARLAVRVGQPTWSNSVTIDTHELVKKAIEQGKVLTFKDATERPAPIYMVPIFRQNRTYALIAIHRLPLAKVTADTTQLLEVLAKWASASLERATAFEAALLNDATYPNSRFLRAPYFHEQCGLEHDRYVRYGIPYTILEATLHTVLRDEDVPGALSELLRGKMRTFDMATWEPESNRLMLLFPTLDHQDASGVAQRVWERLASDDFQVLDTRVLHNECEIRTEMRVEA
ncbi:GAF domain-containing protein [Tumebacillus sp. BK434]|uniref:GAF domain-containing protein n=1 Tax=Tumebacillus sp. BK434 TaxID=2512169 RepID=UPI001047BEE8|nr:GAF domain-containing protein [Tumebacillus sp. BK434]TCP59333.1 GAF domain-containing protein [Tumebacillus sp. BK434]